MDTLGTLHLRQGDPQAAGECFQEAIAHFRQTGERSAQAASVNGLGEVAHVTGAPAAALSFHTEALAIATEGGSRHEQARAHAGLGRAHLGLGDLDLARAHYEHAYAIYTELGMPDAADMLELMGEVPVA
jgi:tetratricopeptide (TPR) repeat protein